nr:hypothetical protein [Tanacetum cinerariifolium]
KYVPTVNQQQPKFSPLDLGLNVLVFKHGDDPIDPINHMMLFLTSIVTSRYPTINNQLKNSSNPWQQATVNNGRVTLQPVQGRQTTFVAGCGTTSFRVKNGKIKMNQVLNENERLSEQIINKDTLNIVVNSSVDNASTYKQLYDSIKSTRVRSKEQCDELINQVNLKSVEISDLNANLQEQGLIIASLRDELRKLKEKAIVDTMVSPHTIDPKMLKVDV